MSDAALVQLNGKDYVVIHHENRIGRTSLQSEIRQFHLDHFAPVFRTQGVQTQEDLQNASTKVFGPFTGGFGRDKIPADLASDPAQYRKFFDSTGDSRWPDGLHNAILDEDSTEVAANHVARLGLDFKGNFLGIFDDEEAVPDCDIAHYQGSDTSWQLDATLLDGGTVNVALDAIEYKGSLIVLLAANDSHVTQDFTDGTTWSAASTPLPTTLLADAVTAHEDIRGGKMEIIKGELCAAIWNEGGGTIDFYSTSAANPVWASESLSVTSVNGPLGLAAYPGIDNTDHMYMLTVEGLWDIDAVTGGAWTARKVRDLRSSNSTGGALALGEDGWLWIAQGVADDSPANVIRMQTQGGIHDFQPIPGNLSDFDAIPSDMLGPIRLMVPSDGFVYTSIGGGAANRKARVLCHNGEGWHSMYQHGTANLKIDFLGLSFNDDSTERLHFGVRTSAGESDTRILERPNANPASVTGTIKREIDSFIDLPFMDGGMPTTSGPFLQTQVDASNLGTTSTEFLNIDYAVNRGTRGGTNLGDITSTVVALDWASGAGVGGRNMALRINSNIDSGTNTNDPITHSVTQAYDKNPPDLEGYEFVVDINATAEHSRITTNAVVSNLDAAHALTDTLPLLVFANVSTYVKVKSVDYTTELEEGSGYGADSPGAARVQRTGFAVVNCVERIK